FSLLWGLGSVIMVKVVHPALAKASSPLPMKVLVPAEAAVLALFVVDLIVSAAAATGLNKKLKEIDEVRARLRVTSDKLTTVLGVSAMTADTILDEQKLQLALAKLEGRENAAELKLEMLLRANEMRAKLRDISVDKIGTRRLLRAFPDMKSLTYAETLASTRAGVRRLNELAAAARTAAKEVAQTAKETAQTAVGTAAAAAQTAKETAANAAQSAAQTAKEAAASAIQTARETGISTPQSTKPAKDEPGQ
ncbi:MAG: putative ABC transporter permease, partial [Gemmiger sp.]